MSRSGVTIVELVVAVAIVSMGVAGVASLTAAAARSLVHARALDEAHVLLLNFVDSVAAEGGSGSGNAALPSGTLSWSVPPTPGLDAWARFEHVALPTPIRIDFTVPTTVPTTVPPTVPPTAPLPPGEA